MKALERIHYEHAYRANSTGYSSLYNKTVPYNQKTISQIKLDNQMTRESNRKFIETIYRTGGFFNYDLKKPHIGTRHSLLII